MTNSKFLIISILVLTISTCANQENNSYSSTTIIYDNQLTHKSIVFSEVDTIGVIMPNISKNYLFKLEGLTTDNQEVKIDDKWILYFAIIDLKGKGYFIPDGIFPSIKQEFMYSMYMRGKIPVQTPRKTFVREKFVSAGNSCNNNFWPVVH